ncbi:MAG: hypothetical protein JNK96_03355, partial [Betaproteobacteria bacterium]|nr:hypothetical protein [Betaproteobacteria bacterium]
NKFDIAKMLFGGDKSALKSAVDEIRAAQPAEAKPSESVPESLLDQHNATMAKLTDGTLSLDQYRAAFATIVENKDAVFAELSKLTKDAIFKRFRALFYRYKNDPKPEIIKAAYRSMMDDFVLSDSIQWSMGQKYEDVIRGYVDAATPESLAAYAEKLQAANAERERRREEIAKAIADPQTLEDYRRLLQAKVDGGKTVDQARMELTPEQRVAFDTLWAEDTRGRRSSAADARKTDVQVAARTTSGDIIETKHTKTGEDLFVVKAAERVERDVYNEWNASAKRLGGRYSSFRGNGAVPGFQFKSRENAVAFLQYLGGDVSAAKEAIQERRDAFADDRSQSAVERLNEMADRLEERADESLAVERKANTARRARFAASAEAAANGDKAMARTMRNIADAIADGTAKFLDRVRQKVQVEMLRSTVASAKYDELRQKYPSYVDQEKHRGEKPTAETADYARWPRFTADRADLARLGRDLLQIDGAKQLGNSILKVADDVTEAYKKFAKENLYKVSVFSVKREGSDEKQMAVFPTAERAEAVIARSGFKGKATTISFKRGEHLVIMGPEMAREAGLWHGDPDKRITLTPEAGEEIVAKVKALGKGKVAMPYVFENVANERARWKAIGIETAAEQRAALREFIALQEAPAAPDRIKQMEREMIGRKNDGLDFFPTPAATAQAMIEAADIKEGMSVLEPSAGMGHIAEQIRDVAGVEPDVIEFSGDRRELLEAKGFNVVGSDFMDMNSRGFTYGDVFRTPDGTLGVMRGSGGLGSNRVGLDPLDANGQPDPRRAIWTDRDELVGVEKRASNSGYDRIIMNPPFSNRRDAEHVQHAYSLLKPGGRLVAIMGEGVFYGQDKKAQAFRDWMESVGGTSEKLEEGTFLDPSLPVNTGVNARMVVIDKSGNGAPQALESRAPSFDSSDAPQTTLIRRVVDSFLAHFQGAAALDVRVVASRNEIPPRYRPSPYAEGVYHDADGVVYLISSNLPTQARAWQVLMHEAIGHYGLSNLMGEKFAALQSTVLQKATSGRELTRHPQPGEADYATVEAVRRLYPEASDSEVAQEVLARMAEMMDPPGWSKILFAQVRHWLRTAARAMNLTVEPSLQEAKDMVVLAAKHLRDGNNLQREMAGDGQAFASEGAPRLAPNGQPSKLNAHQWKQVRTPEFKAWFGDWEASAILNGEPLASMKTADAPSGGFKAVEDWAASLFAEQGGVAVREGLGEVLLDRRAAKTSMAHGGANQYEKVAFAAVKDVIERGALVHRTANGDVDSFYFSAPVDIDGVTNIETVLVHRDANTGRMYLHSVMAKESLLNHQVSRADAGASERSGSTDSEGISRILQDLVRRNGVSKVVDENGEPLVVYHGTDADIYAFSQSFLGHTTGAKSAKAGFFFASNPETADYYPQYDKETVLDAYGFMRKKGETTEEYRRRMESPEGTPSGRLESAMHKYRATVPPAIAALNLSGRFASSPKSQLDAYLLHGDPSRFAGQFRSSEIGDELEAAGFFDAQDDKSPQEAMELFEAEVARRVRAEGETAIALKIDALDQDGRQALEAARAAAVVYRMAKKESDEFNFRYQWSKKSWAGGDQDGEVWEASKESQAPNIIPVFLAIKRPFIHDFKGKGYREVSYAELLEGAKVGDHDGATFLRTADPTPADIFVAFDPTQIKSAISNRGSFDGTNPNILESRSAGPVQWKAPEPSRLDDLIYSMQDKHVDMKRVVQSIKKTAGTISDNIDPYLQEELFHGRAAKAVKDFLDLELRPLIAEMRMRGVGMADFEEYLWNRHAEERNAQIAKINPQMPDGGSGLATADARAYLAGLSSDKRKAYESLAAKIDAITARNRQVLVDSGLEKAETVAAWEGAYKHYVPLQREDVETGGNGTGQGFSVRGTSSKRAVGSGRPVADIIANIAMQRERFIVKAEKNRVSIAIAGLAASNPNPDFWKLNEAPKERVVNNVALYNVLDANGNKVADFTRMDEAERMARSMGGEVEQTWGDRVQERIVPGFKNQENVVHFRLNGDDHFVVFNEREPRALRMAQSIKNLDMDQLGRVLTVAGKATRYFASINTQYNPIFGVINLFRDVQGALLNLSTTPLAGEQKRVAGYTVDALRGIYADIRAHRSGKVPSSRWASLYEEFQNEGGQTGYRDQFSNAEQRAEAIAKEIRSMDRNVAFKATGAVFDWLSDYNQAMENAVRLAAYAAAKDRGLSKQQAASLAKNLTVNFNRKGQVATQMGALYAFFNASMQGTARLAQTLTGPMGRRIITGGILLGSMQALLLASAGMGDDEPPEFVRERNLILPIGDGKYISLPMPLGFHVLPNLGRIPVEFVMSGFREPARRISDLVAIFADTFNPIGNAGLSLQTIAPTVVDPFAALAENKDWTGKPIAKMDMNANSPT